MPSSRRSRCRSCRSPAPSGTCKPDFKTACAAWIHAGGAHHTTGKKLLWGTACLFSHPRYSQGAGTSPTPGLRLRRRAGEEGDGRHLKLGGEGYTFWGGREGYATLLNTDMKRELDHLAALLHMAVDYAKKIGFTGQFYIEPKPREPSTHQYDSTRPPA
jgi:xylose isomerase